MDDTAAGWGRVGVGMGGLVNEEDGCDPTAHSSVILLRYPQIVIF